MICDKVLKICMHPFHLQAYNSNCAGNVICGCLWLSRGTIYIGCTLFVKQCCDMQLHSHVFKIRHVEKIDSCCQFPSKSRQNMECFDAYVLMALPASTDRRKPYTIAETLPHLIPSLISQPCASRRMEAAACAQWPVRDILQSSPLGRIIREDILLNLGVLNSCYGI